MYLTFNQDNVGSIPTGLTPTEDHMRKILRRILLVPLALLVAPLVMFVGWLLNVPVKEAFWDLFLTCWNGVE